MNILQVNVRLREGGAAQVACTLEKELELLGHRSFFLYGYSFKGKNSQFHNYSRHFKFTSRFEALVNLITFRLLGRERNINSASVERKLAKILRQVDVVHLHVFHSYFIDYSILFSVLAKSNIPVVWTLHDQWILTGRCALPGKCRAWEKGCERCPDKQAYPPAIIDRAASNYRFKRENLIQMTSKPNFLLVACAKWLEKEIRNAGFENITTITNSIDPEFQNAFLETKVDKKGTNLFICRDLTDKNKVNWNFLRKVSAIPNQKLTIVGDNSPITITGAEYIPSTNSRTKMVELYLSHTRLIFTSVVDHYPLTIIEALACGIEVYALNSPAAREFEDHPNCYIFDDLEKIYEQLENGNLKIRSVPQFEVNQKFDFTPSRMAQEYAALYKTLIENV